MVEAKVEAMVKAMVETMRPTDTGVPGVTWALEPALESKND